MNCKRCQALLIPPSEPKARRAVEMRFMRHGAVCEDCRESEQKGQMQQAVLYATGVVFLLAGYTLESIGCAVAGLVSLVVGAWRHKFA